MKKQLSMTLMGSFICIAASVSASSGANWSYAGPDGPEHWGTLSPDYEMCAQGKNQSPINITGTVEAELNPITFSYKNSGMDIVNNGHTIKANYDAGSEIMIDDDRYDLLQIHWHTPSENRIEGESFPMEAHFVHSDPDGKLAVIGVMYKLGEANKAISAIWDTMPRKTDTMSQDSQVMLNANDMLPDNKEYYRFNGSLTTPPCSEGVRWMVMKDSVEASKEQIEKFHSTFHGDTNRSVQPIHARPVLK